MAAARTIQSLFQMARTMRLLKQLFGAVAWLRQGGVLWKFRGGALVEDTWHPRIVKLSADLRQLLWTRIPGSTVSTPRLTKKNAEGDLREKALPMESITALAEGAKTVKLKKRAQAEDEEAAPSMLTRTYTFAKGAPKPSHVKDDCTFSIISRERTLDLAADSPAQRAKWMSYLQLLLVQQHTFDSASVLSGGAGVMQQIDAMSGKVAELKRKQTQAQMDLKNSRKSKTEHSPARTKGELVRPQTEINAAL